MHLQETLEKPITQLIVYIACLPYEAWYSLCAILRTSWRMLITKQHLLEWMPFEQCLNENAITWITTMWIGPIAALTAAMVIFINGQSDVLISALPLLLLWFTSPLLMHYLSQPLANA